MEEMDEEWSKAAAQQWEDSLQQWEWEEWEIITLIAVTTNISHLSSPPAGATCSDLYLPILWPDIR